MNLFLRIGSKIEDFLFSVLLKLPLDSFPASVAERIENHIDKRICQLQQENIKSSWRCVQLESTLQEMKKAPLNE